MTKAKTKDAAALPTQSALADRFKDFPAIDVLERRLLDPRDPGTLPILLKDDPDPHCANSDHWWKHTAKIVAGAAKCPTCGLKVRKWYLRWISAGEEGWWANRRAKGYVPVTVQELPDQDMVASLYKSDRDDYVRRGDRGLEILAKIPFPYFLEFQRKEQELRKKTSTAKAVKAQAAEVAGHELGSEAGDVIHEDIKVFQDTRHRSTLAAEIGADPE